MKFTCAKCGTISDIPLSLSDCASAMGNEGIKTILQTPEQIKKEWHSKGGNVRAIKYSKEQITAWAKMGGRPKKTLSQPRN